MTEPREDALDNPELQIPDTDLPDPETGNDDEDDTADAPPEGEEDA